MARNPTPTAASSATPLGVGAGLFVIHLAASGFALFYGLKAAAARPGSVSLTMVEAVHRAARVLTLPLAALIGLGGIVRGGDLEVWGKLCVNSAVWASVAALCVWGWQRRHEGALDARIEGHS